MEGLGETHTATNRALTTNINNHKVFPSNLKFFNFTFKWI